MSEQSSFESPERETVQVWDLGRISYREAWDLQTRLLQELVDAKRAGRDLPGFRQDHHYLLLCEHPPVYTLGKSGDDAHLLLNEDQLKEKGIEYFHINRGGDITFHGPGQLVGYPILDLEAFFTDLHRYIRTLEECILETIAANGLEGIRVPGYTGVWMEASGDRIRRKVCAIGVHMSRWVTMHGFALNINTDLDYFNHIVPCGIDPKDGAVTSMAAELGHSVDMDAVKKQFVRQFGRLFGCRCNTETNQ